MMNSIFNYAQKTEIKNLRQTTKEKGHYINVSGNKPIKEITPEQQGDKHQKSTHTNRLEKIMDKLQNGEKLSSEEMEYLRKNVPELYEKALQICTERAACENELKNCKSKEEVQRLKMNKTASYLSQLNGISNNPDLSQKQKEELTELVQMKAAAINNAALAFVQNGSYARLKSETDNTIELGREMDERIGILLDDNTDEYRNTSDFEKVYASTDTKPYQGLSHTESTHAKALYQKALETVTQSTELKAAKTKNYI